MSKLQLAILDLYNGIPNQGMRCIKEIVDRFASDIEYRVFDVRVEGAVPKLEDFDIFISSGGPGDPREYDGWGEAYFQWLDKLWVHNQRSDQRKFLFLICHSFQMAVHHFRLAQVGARKSISFGTFPVHLTQAGKDDPQLGQLRAVFYAADFRRFQAIQPDKKRMEEMGAKVLCLEKKRPHIPLERAIMAIRFSPEILGTQFHPEADPEGMLAHFSRPEIKTEVVAEHGRDKWLRMIGDLMDPRKINRTHDTVIPGFLEYAIEELHRMAGLTTSSYS
ncbi:MAG: GMP synthase [Bacteroidota bacterium]